jgi:hypothetical protein
MTHALSVARLAEKLDAALDAGDGSNDIRAMLTEFAEAEAIPL